MREFTEKETKFIVEHQDSISLEELAMRFNCDWKDVYWHYSETLKRDAYKRFTDQRREHLNGWKSIRFSE